MQHTVKFVLDDKITEVNFSDQPRLKPTTTLLNWLRSVQGHKGVKEGCGQGDCGACTVVIAEPSPSGRKLLYKAVNSCLIFLPMIHGKQVITVENLAITEGKEKKLHPVQQMLVETYGTQCGYCTPGIVMSLFALFKNHHNPSDEIIKDSLTGNLCRCTGYRPIMEAARRACNGHDDHFTVKEKEIIKLLNEIKRNNETIEIKTGRQAYFKPFTLEEALRLKREYPDAILINGSTDIAPRKTKDRKLLSMLIDLSGVEEIKFIREENNSIVIGAGTTLEEVRKISETKLPSLFEILKVFGSLQIRNLGTIGGNIATASPVGDTLPLLIAIGAGIKLTSASSERTLPIEDFITGYRKTDIKQDELITEIKIPIYGRETKIATYKISKRRDLDISTVSGAFRLKLHDGKVNDIALVFGGMAVRAMHAISTEEFLIGKRWSRALIEEVGKVLAEEFSPITDARAGTIFRKTATCNLLMKFYLETIAGI